MFKERLCTLWLFVCSGLLLLEATQDYLNWRTELDDVQLKPFPSSLRTATLWYGSDVSYAAMILKSILNQWWKIMINAPMHLSFYIFLSEHVILLVVFRWSHLSLCPPGSLGPAPRLKKRVQTWTLPSLIHLSHVHCQSYFLCVCINPWYSLPLYTSSFLHSSICFLKKSRRKHLIYFCIFSKCIFNNRSLFPPDLVMVMV